LTAIQLVVGLGNPGRRYAETRHNAGFWLVSALAERAGARFRPVSRFLAELADWEINGHRCQIAKPATFMNRSGQAVAALAHYYRYSPEQLLVVHDEIDLPPGVVRLKAGGGGSHRGLRDIIQALGSRDFLRLRLGVGHPGRSDEVTAYVLQRAPTEEQVLIERALDRVLELFPSIVAGELQRAMNILHAEPDSPEPERREDDLAKPANHRQERP
jgi:PTH1 family peptidyl-tRNA hydrolase